MLIDRDSTANLLKSICYLPVYLSICLPKSVLPMEYGVSIVRHVDLELCNLRTLVSANLLNQRRDYSGDI